MVVLVDDDVAIAYGQMYVDSRAPADRDGDPWPFVGQRNGLCGAAEPGYLFLKTATHTGHVPLTVERHDEDPPLAAFWEDVVEVSFRPATAETWLLQWDMSRSWRLDLEQRDYRARYCAYGWDFAEGDDDEDSEEQYLLQFWPAPPAEDRLVRQESRGGEHLAARF
ncbi:hypothetical protein [Dactylosporangium sp. NPDC050588]|uniref:hypothetical protein n=1 Tax=Dactylosporangium sp. NPDC050588 TaxID=3157211 RepID=UPI00340A2BC1